MYSRPRCLGNRAGVFAITFTSYVFLHAARKTFSAVKEELVGGNATFLNGDGVFQPEQQDEMSGLLDASFLCMYAAGLFVAGWVSDRVDARLCLVTSQGVSGLLVGGFGIAGFLGVRHILFYVILWGFHGLFQSLAFPACMKVLTAWFPVEGRGWVLGVWGCSSALGNILGGGMAAVARHTTLGTFSHWEIAMLIAAATIFLHGTLLVWSCLLVRPPPTAHAWDTGFTAAAAAAAASQTSSLDPLSLTGSVSFHSLGNMSLSGALLEGNVVQEQGDGERAVTTSPGEDEDGGRDTGGNKDGGGRGYGGGSNGGAEKEHRHSVQVVGSTLSALSVMPTTAISFRRACCIPGVLAYALAFACVKAVLYSFLFWLPFYLSTAFKLEPGIANLYAMSYDLGSVIGGTAAGFLVDRFLRGTGHGLVAMVGLGASGAPLLFLALNNPSATGGMSLPATVVVVFLSGCFLGGPSTLIAGIAAADFGNHASLRREHESAVGTVSGIIDGTGSIGAAAVQFLVGFLSACRHINHGSPLHGSSGGDSEGGGNHSSTRPFCERSQGCQDCTWRPVFVMMLAATAMAYSCLARYAMQDYEALRKKRRCREAYDS